MEKTMQNLKEAFAGESQANRKYLAYAEQAAREGHMAVAKLFRAAAAAETVHAHNHLRVMGGVRGTAENLQDAIAGETFEFRSMYPEMIHEAEAEGDAAALRSFMYANEVEKIHAGLYQLALDNLGSPVDIESYYVCTVCGNTVADAPPDICPICKSKAMAFKLIE